MDRSLLMRDISDAQQNLKRKNEFDEENIENSKKLHNDIDFSGNQIAAESTHIENTSDLSLSTKGIVESLTSETSNDDELTVVDHADTIVEACLRDVEDNDSFKELVAYLQSELKRKDKMIEDLSTEIRI